MEVTPIVEAGITPDTAVDDRFRLLDDEHDFVVMDPAVGKSVLSMLLKSEKEAGSDKSIAPHRTHNGL